MTVILIEYERKSPTTELLHISFDYLSARYGCVVVWRQNTMITAEDLKGCDVVISVRGNSPASLLIAKLAKQSGKYYCVYLDDDLINYPSFYRYKKRVVYANMIASMADTIITSNKLIGEDCKNRFNVKYVILDSIVEQQEINSAICEKPCSETIKILFAGNSEHKYAFEKYIAPILKEVSDSSLYKISITCIGVYPNIKPISSKLDVCYMPSMPLEQYRWYVKNQKFDIGIAVIEDNRFSHRKYINKFFEFTIIGAVGVYTNCLPYKDAIIDHYNGFLCDNTLEEWRSTLINAINNVEARRTCFINANGFILARYTPEIVLSRLISTLPELVNYQSNKTLLKLPLCINFQQRLFHIFEKIDQIFYYASRDGVSGVWKRIKMRIGKVPTRMN